MFKQQLKYDLFQAYYDARCNKRNTVNQLRFEIEYERNLLELHEEIVNRTYRLKPSIAFIVDNPIKREVFAADFRDRIIHHLIFNYINPLLDVQFIPDSYSCRKGKGTLYGINRAAGYVKECSDNYTKDCYILKLDISGYFMSIDKHLLWKKLQTMLEKACYVLHKNDCFDFELVNYLLKKVIWNDPRKGCIMKSNLEDWSDLPPSKSLFHAAPNCGLPIGNFTSQLFSNIYLHDFDCFVKNELGIKYYGRYVDDFLLIHPDKTFLLSIKEKMKCYLQENCRLTLHPKKIYLQHYTKGVAFLGAYIKPNRIYIGNRTKKFFFHAVRETDKILAGAKKNSSLKYVRASLNSYLGIMKHYNSYNIRRKALLKVSHEFFKYGYLGNGLGKYVLKNKMNK